MERYIIKGGKPLVGEVGISGAKNAALAIVAAAMIPTMLGYVTEARGKAYADEARVVYNAAQTLATEMAALGHSNDDIEACLNDAADGTMDNA